MLLEIDIPNEYIVKAFNVGIHYTEWAEVVDKYMGTIDGISQEAKGTTGACALSYGGRITLRAYITGNIYTITRSTILKALQRMAKYEGYLTSIINGHVDVQVGISLIGYCTYINEKD